MSQLTLADIAAPSGPFLLEMKMTAPDGMSQRWLLLQSVRTVDEGLTVASRGCQCYSHRLYLGPDDGYLYLDWIDDPDDPDMCLPKWIRK